MTPNLGQGACQAIEDALVLSCGQLERGPGEAVAALRRYEAEGDAPHAVLWWRPRDGSDKLFQIESPALCRLRDLTMRMTPASVSYRSLAAIAGYEAHLDAEIKS